MEHFVARISLESLERFLETIEGNFLIYLTAALFLLELVRYGVKKRLSASLIGDSLANGVTFMVFGVITYFVIGAFYVSGYYWAWSIAPYWLDITPLSIIACVVLADLCYYCEHRFTHRVNVAWATHSVHHSSPHFNLSVAYRFGPMDAFWPFFFHVPLVLMGFDPILVLVSEAVVQAYQTWLHTEAIGKLPRPVELVMNTPSHHRVHHARNPQYIDKNYGGIFIIWDRLFGSFAKEGTEVDYGLVKSIHSINPVKIMSHGFSQLAYAFVRAQGIRKLRLLIGPPRMITDVPDRQDSISTQ